MNKSLMRLEGKVALITGAAQGIGKGIIIGGASLSLEQANHEIDESYVDLVTWARSILANVDFVSQLKNNKELRTMTDKIRMELY